MKKFFCDLWERPVGLSHFLLHPLELLYRSGFYFVNRYKKCFGGYSLASSRVISVGNLSVGGTGKSVLVSYLVCALQARGEPCAIISRGYGRKSKERNAVAYGSDSSPARFGDEVAMLARSLGVPVAVGSNRVASAKRLHGFTLILDDAYQNHQLKKDCEILLLDARKPFGNGHCLPVGPLREKDFSRAGVIILTHSDQVLLERLHEIKTLFLKSFPQEKIFFGKHKVSGVRSALGGKGPNGPVLAVAGIGSFSGFLSSLKSFGVKTCGVIEYPDHHAYTKQDASFILEKARSCGAVGIITTEKDWVKLEPLVENNASLFYILTITFGFVNDGEEERFLNLLDFIG